LPWIVLVLGLTLLATIQWQAFEPGEMGPLVAAFALGLFNDVIFLSWARTNLRTLFRVTATQRFDGKGSVDLPPVNAVLPEIVSPPVLVR
jgi:hypothetical protein